MYDNLQQYVIYQLSQSAKHKMAESNSIFNTNAEPEMIPVSPHLTLSCGSRILFSARTVDSYMWMHVE